MFKRSEASPALRALMAEYDDVLGWEPAVDGGAIIVRGYNFYGSGKYLRTPVSRAEIAAMVEVLADPQR